MIQDILQIANASIRETSSPKIYEENMTNDTFVQKKEDNSPALYIAPPAVQAWRASYEGESEAWQANLHQHLHQLLHQLHYQLLHQLVHQLHHQLPVANILK